ncbi:hypothetical protein EDB85DRAFT_2181548 [Lactarius pseudohatsudake]|nr:hypothetical protein EDB85DRAFT_2181548 [Lactarius pseudohatsudake]
MPSTKKAQWAAAARARATKYQKRNVESVDSEISSDPAIEQPEPNGNHEPDIECTGWTGGVNYVPSDTDSDSDDEDWKETDLDDESDGGGELEDLEGEDLLDGLRNEWELLQQELESLEEPTPYEHLLGKTMAKEWKKAEANDQVEQFRSFFTVVPKVPALPLVPSSQEAPGERSANTEYEDGVVDHNVNAIFRGYLSDTILSEGEDGVDWADDEDNSLDPDAASQPVNHLLSTRSVIPSPPRAPKPKRRKLDIPARTAQEQAKQARSQELKDALLDIEKLITSRKTQFVAGANGLQSKPKVLLRSGVDGW